MSLTVTPVSQVNVQKYHIPRHGLIPNSDADSKPFVYYKSLFPSGLTKPAIRDFLASVNVVKPQWTYTMYPTDHFHTTCHEVIVILTGKALLVFGGEKNPARVELEVSKGDAFIIPAGVSHKQLKEIGMDVFEMIGAYPLDAEHWDMCYGLETEGNTDERIKKVAWFTEDPFYGANGPAVKV